MGRDTAGKLRERAPHNDNGVLGDFYHYAVAGRVSDHLESTQLNKFGTKGGTGFAAEDTNALNEKLRGVKVGQMGINNAKNGPDRVSGGVHIQTKYFGTAAKTVNDAFDKATGTYRYLGMQLEVPRDQYEKAVGLMRKKISEGKVPGVIDPREAINLVKEGSVTYQQAKNIARAGNIESLKFDVKNNAVLSGYAFAIGFAINFAKAKWEGKTTKEAIQESVNSGLLAGGTSFIAGVATSQMLRTQLAREATVVIRHGVKAVAGTTLGRPAVDKVASASAGKALSGAAAANHASKLLRTNVITGVVTTVVLTGPDLYRAAISKNTSWAQVGKNLMVNGAGVAAGTAGWMCGAAAGGAIGTAIMPGPGTAVGAFVGGLIGSIGAGAGGSYVAKKVLDRAIEDDASQMLKIVEEVLPVLGDEYLMTQTEFDQLLEVVSKTCTAEFLREMYSKDARGTFVRSTFEPKCEAIIKQRQRVILPIAGKVQRVLDDIIASVDSEASRQATAGKVTRRMSNSLNSPIGS
ncbi:MAG: hypothetical protein JWP36_1027 [Paucimonas sp.]|nr:hypothetical protein [Paucimonas sp.]